jgi:type II secretory pathway pseudopilin PulG
MKISRQSRASLAAFTMVELALCIAVVSIAMVAIIGVLPLGMNVQKQNREDTIINQDAQILMDALRTASASGASITNFYSDPLKVANRLWEFSNAADYFTNFVDYVVVTNVFGRSYWRGPWYLKETGGDAGDPARPSLMDGHMFLNALLTLSTETNSGRFVTNVVFAQMRPITSPVIDYPASLNQKAGLPPERFDHVFRYIVTAEVTRGMPLNAGLYEGEEYERLRQLTNSLFEVRLTFEWPVTAQNPDMAEPNVRPSVGPNRRTFRTLLSGNLETKVVRTSANKIVAAEIPGANPARVPLREFKPSVFVQAPPL